MHRDAIGALLTTASTDPHLADRIVAIAKQALSTRGTAAAIAAKLATGGNEEENQKKRNTATQRLSDLRSDKERGRRWLLDAENPERLEAILNYAGIGADELPARIQAAALGFHPAWPELSGSADYMLDIVPGLRWEELQRHVGALRPGIPYVIVGPHGSGLTTWLRRLEGLERGHYVTEPELAHPERVQLIDTDAASFERVCAQVRAGALLAVVAAHVEPRPWDPVASRVRADATLGPWGAPEIAELARRLAASPPGSGLDEIDPGIWQEIAGLTTWTPLELGYVLRAFADGGPGAASPRALGRLLVEGVLSARSPEIDAAFGAEAFEALLRASFERARGPGEWPSPLSNVTAKKIVERLGDGARSALARPFARAQLRSELASIRRIVGTSTKLKPARDGLDRIERALEPPKPGATLDALERAEFVRRDGERITFAKLADLVTAGLVSWDELLERTGDRSLHGVMLAALPRLEDTSQALDALLRRGAARQLIDLRVALGIVARAHETASGEDARAVIGSAAALLQRHTETPWLGLEAFADLHRASERYARELTGELPVLPAVARWLELTPASTFGDTPAPEELLPWQHLDAILAPGQQLPRLPSDVLRRLLQSAVESEHPRALEIASGVAEDPCDCQLGALLPTSARLALLTRRPPAAWEQHAEAIARVAFVARNDVAAGKAIVEALTELLARSDVPPGDSEPRIEGFPTAWLDAAQQAGREDVVRHAWRRRWSGLQQELSQEDGAVRLWEALERDGDARGCLATADALAELGDLSALREMAEAGRGTHESRGTVIRPVDVRWRLAKVAARKLVERRDAPSLRALLDGDDGYGPTAAALDAACESVENAHWIARELSWWRAVRVVLDAHEQRCLALIRQWADDPAAPPHGDAISALLRRRDPEDEERIAAWMKSGLSLWHIPELLTHPSNRLRRAAVRWLATELERVHPGGGGLRALSPEASDRDRAYVVQHLEEAARVLAPRATAETARILARMVELLAADGDGDPRIALSLGEVFRVLVHVDSDRAAGSLDAISDLGRSDVATDLARRWASDRPREVPERVLESFEPAHGWDAELHLQRMPLDELTRRVVALDHAAWSEREHPAGESLVERYPWAAIRALAARAPERFDEHARERVERLARSQPAHALAVAEWMIAFDAPSAAQALELALRAGTRKRRSGRTVRNERGGAR